MLPEAMADPTTLPDNSWDVVVRFLSFRQKRKFLCQNVFKTCFHDQIFNFVI